MGLNSIAACVLPAFLASTAFAADATGTWTASFESEVGSRHYNYVFKVDNGKLTGTAESGGYICTIENGTIKGDEISFSELMTNEGPEYQITYKGKISGNEIKFTRTVADGITQEFIAKRVNKIGK